MNKKGLISILCILTLAVAVTACNPIQPEPTFSDPISTPAPAVTPTAPPTPQGPAGVNSTATIPPDLMNGGALGAPIFLKNCSHCHGIEGQGGIGVALRNNPLIVQLDENTLSLMIDGGVGKVMPAWLQKFGGPLTEDQVHAVVGYLKTMQGLPPMPTSTPEITPTEALVDPNAPTAEPAHPSAEGGPGPAAAMAGDPEQAMLVFGMVCAQCHGPQGRIGVPNPGSDDGFVPVLNPIDDTIANPDPKVFAAQVDVFIEHGSIPSGPDPTIKMPAFGDRKMLTDQQIADLIAYVIKLNTDRKP